MKWRKSPDALVRVFEHSLPIVEGVQVKPMFGYPCAFLNGHLFCGLHGDGIIVLLSEARRNALLAEGASVYEPVPEQPTKEYVVVPSEIVADRQRLRSLLSDALAHVSSLAPEPKKPTAAKTKAARRKAPPKKKAAPARKAAPAKKSVATRKAPARNTRATKTKPAKKTR
jgi:hypothetical protein